MARESPFEEQVNAILKELHVPFIWNGSQNNKNPKRFQLSNNPKDNYTPDFILFRAINGRQLLLEPHGKIYFDKSEIIRLRKFRLRYYDYYLVVITESAKEFYEQLKQNNLNRKQVCDNLWVEPKFNETQKSKHKPNKKSKKFWKKLYEQPFFTSFPSITLQMNRYNFIKNEISLLISESYQIDVPNAYKIKQPIEEIKSNNAKADSKQELIPKVGLILLPEEEKADKLLLQDRPKEALKIYRDLIKNQSNASAQQRLLTKIIEARKKAGLEVRTETVSVIHQENSATSSESKQRLSILDKLKKWLKIG